MRSIKGCKTQRVVITGLGVISSLGFGWEDFWRNLIDGKSGISQLASLDTKNYDRHYGGEIKNFEPSKFISKRQVALMGRSSQFALTSSKLALIDANVKISELKKKRVGVSIGTTMGEVQVMERVGDREFPGKVYTVDSVSAFSYPASAISKNVALQLKLNNYNIMFSNACAAGNYAIGHSYDLIKSGKADLMLAGGVDGFSRITFTGFARLYAIAPQKCQPFDKNRKGMVPGEGAGIILMESLDSAVKRNAKIYSEVCGYGLSCDGYHMTKPKSAGLEKAIKKALTYSGIKINEVDYISAHGTGTQENDKTESEALYRVFGKNLKNIPVSSIKSMLGHTMGAAAALEAISCCLIIGCNKIPPTINFTEKDPECDIDCVPNQSRQHKVNIALNNSQAFGGNNACLILKKY